MDPAIVTAWVIILVTYAVLMRHWWHLRRLSRALAAARELLDDEVALFVEQRAESRALHPSSPGMCRSLAECARMCHRAEQAEAALAERGDS